MSHRNSLAGAALLLAAATIPASAQTGWQEVIGVGYESYSFSHPEESGIESLSLLVLPLGIQAPLPAGARLEIRGAYARGELVGSDGVTRTLAGPTDTRVSLDAPVAGGLRLGLLGVLPTGASDLTDEEAVVAGAVAADLLPFRITHWGSGGGLGVISSLAHSFGSFGLAASASYTRSREFDAFANGGAQYRPGDQVRVQLGGELDVTTASRLTLLASYQNSTEDQLGGANLYRAGDRFQAVGAYSFATGRRGSAITYGGWLHRSQGARLLETGDESAPAEDLMLFGGSMRLSAGRGVLAPATDVRLYRNEAGLGQGYSASVGLSLEWPLGAAVWIPSVRGRYGSVEIREEQESNFTGVDLGMSLRFGGRNR